jgi:hypothetical protein
VVDIWEDLSLAIVDEKLFWITKSEDILRNIKDFPELRDRLVMIYKNLALPADLPRPLPSSIIISFGDELITIEYNKFGFPKFAQHMTKILGPNGENLIKSYKGAWNPGNTAMDLTKASTWAMNNYPTGSVRRYKRPGPNGPGTGTTSYQKIEILKDGHWIEQTWHHHENGKDLLPIPSEIHNPLNHSGGASIKNGSTDATAAFQYDPFD